MNSSIRIIPESIKRLKISDEEYFGNTYKKYISNSKLSLINPDEEGSPQKFKAGLENNQIHTEALALGSAVHQVILQPEEYYLNTEVDKPTGKMFFAIEDIIKDTQEGMSMYDAMLKASDKYNYFKGKITLDNYEEKLAKSMDYYNYKISNPGTHDSKGREYIYLDSYNRWRAFSCIKAVKESNSSKLLKPQGIMNDPLIFNEDTFTCDVEVTFNDQSIILPLKLKVDNWTLDLESDILTLNDLKTTGKDVSLFSGSFEKYHYARQIAMYFWILNEYCKFTYNKTFKKYTNIIVVETNKPFTSKVFPISEKRVIGGLKEFKRLLTEVAYCEIYGYK